MSTSNTPSLTDAILGFVNELDWATRKQVVERHRDLLLDDEVDSVLEAAIANNVRRPEIQQRFQLCRTVLADCRAIGIDAAFVLSIGPTPGLMEALKDLLAAESATAAHDTTVRHQALLLTDEADWVLAAMAYESREETFFVERVAHRRELLGRCRHEGIEPAFADMLREDRTTEALRALIPALGSAEDAAAVLKQYEDVLLTDSAARSVEEMAAEPDLEPDVARAFASVGRLLHLARVDGISAACATYLLPPFEQFINRCLFALAKDPDQNPGRRVHIVELLHAEFDKVDHTFPHDLHKWCQTVLETATQEELRIYVAGVARLGKTLQDFPTGGTPRHTQAATACFQTANKFSQRACVLRQKQARKERTFASVQEAVAAAIRMKTEEGFDLFRGQRCDWPVVSSFRRLDSEQQADAVARVNQFIHWTNSEAALKQYEFSSDAAIAVAQHYGVATTFLDFSTDIEVARYFATEHCLEPAYQDATGPSELSCIVAIRSAHVDTWVKERFRRTNEFLGSQVLRLEVPNLWRIEAQAGVFLVDDEIIDSYPFHYLLFPASLGPEPARARATVYPDKRSDLELILDQWFWHEEASTGTRRLSEMLEQGGAVAHRVTFGPTTGVGLKSIVRPEPHPSWAGREKTWLRATERFESVLPRPGDTFQVDLRPGLSLDVVRSLVATLLPLDSLADRRKRSADWCVLVDSVIDVAAGQKLARQWDALRIDGYSDAQLVASFATSISLLAVQLGLIAGWPSYGGSLGISDDIKPMTSLFGSDLLVEFSGLVGYSRALVSAADLQSAVREDLDRYVPADLYQDCGPTLAERMHQLLIGIHSPSLLFDFARFADIYVRQVVPMSVIFRPELPLYPVLHLQTFGVP
jgi:hypothetical protein